MTYQIPPELDEGFYDRQGKPIKLLEWAALKEGNDGYDYIVVAKSLVWRFRVSTVWLGLDHGGGRWNHKMGLPVEPPIIFETMIFGGGSYMDLYCDRYPTEETALAGHQKAVRWARRRSWRELAPRLLYAACLAVATLAIARGTA